MTHAVVVCLTEPDNSWKVLVQAVEQCRIRNAELHLLFCQKELCACSGMSRHEINEVITDIGRSARILCDEAGVDLTIETVWTDGSSNSIVSKIIMKLKADLLVLSEKIPHGLLNGLIPTPAEKMARGCECSVLIVR